jgi:hypothetical protein
MKYFYSNARLRELLLKATQGCWADDSLAPDVDHDKLAPDVDRDKLAPDDGLVTYVSPDGKFRQTFHWQRGCGRLVSAIRYHPDGKVVSATYLGDRGSERLAFLYDGDVRVTCSGPPTKEYGIETVLKNGIKYYFEEDGAIDLSRYALDLRHAKATDLPDLECLEDITPEFLTWVLGDLREPNVDDSADDGTTTFYSHPFETRDGRKLRIVVRIVRTAGNDELPVTIEVLDSPKKPEKPMVIPDNTTVCLGKATPDDPLTLSFEGYGQIRVQRPHHTTARNSRTPAEDRASVAMRGFERNRTNVYQELSRLDSQGSPLDAQAMPMYGSDGAAPKGSSQLCIMGPGGVHKTFDFTGMSREDRTNAAADAVMAIGTSCAPPGYELSATAQGIEIISRPGDDGSEAPVPQTMQDSPRSERMEREYAEEALRCLETNTIPERPEVRRFMAQHLIKFKEWSNVPSAYSTLVKMACLAPKIDDYKPYRDYNFLSFIKFYLELFAYMVRQPHCPTVARAFAVVCKAIGFNTKVDKGWDLLGYRRFRCQAELDKVTASFDVVREQLAEKCPYDSLSNFDTNPLWQSISDGKLCFYKREKEFVLRAPEDMQMEADMASEALLRGEEESKAKAATSSGKASKRRARQKQKKEKKEKAQLAQLEPIGEDEEFVTPNAEEAPLPVAVEEQGDAPSADAGVFNLSDIGSALADKQEDAATSVATALMCIICYCKERSVACVPCGHKCLCEDCGTKETMSTANGCPCPMCREEVMMFMKVFE